MYKRDFSFFVLSVFALMVFAIQGQAEPNTVAQNTPQVSKGALEIITDFKSNHIGERTVYIWFPEKDYYNKKYPVLYMYDGQMLFDETVTWNGQAWNVDDVADTLIKQQKVKKFVVVGIENAGEKLRNAEYFPEKAISYVEPPCDKDSCEAELFGATLYADQYLRFLVEELKPFIAENFSLNIDRKNSFLMGSSMGGLISMYALSEYPDEFLGAACLSTHWLGARRPEDVAKVSKGLLSYVKKHLPDSRSGHRFYFDYGTQGLDQYYEPLQTKVDDIMRFKGYKTAHWLTQKFVGASHDEVSWNQRLHIPLQFLFGE